MGDFGGLKIHLLLAGKRALKRAPPTMYMIKWNTSNQKIKYSS